MKLLFWQRDKAEETRSCENPATPLTPENLALGFDGPTAAGVVVNEESALALSAVYAAISLLSATIAQLPLCLHRRTETNSELAKDLPLFNLLARAPYPEYTSYVWRETQSAHMVGWGNGYSHIERDFRGNARGLRLLMPARTWAERKAGRLVYRTEIDGKPFDIAPGDILHTPALSFTGLMGKSPIRLQAESLGVGLAAQQFGGSFYANGTHWGSMLKLPHELTPDARNNLKAGLREFKAKGYQGTFVADGGADLQRLSIPPEEAQFIETRKMSVTEVARLYNIPPHMLGDLDKASFNNITEMSIGFLRYTMTPWLIRWEQELDRKLLGNDQELFFKFNVGGLMRGTQKERYEAYKIAVGQPFMAPNEARGLEDMDPIEGFDRPSQPLNMDNDGGADNDEDENGGDGDEGTPDEGENDSTRSLFAPLVTDFAEKLNAYDQKITAKIARQCVDDKLTESQSAKALEEELLSGGASLIVRHLSPLAKAAELAGLATERDLMVAVGDWFHATRMAGAVTVADIETTLHNQFEATP